MKLERILVPVDFSECSRRALEHAAVFATSFGATVDLLHVFGAQDHLPPEATAAILGEGTDHLEQLARAHAEKELDAVAADARERGIRVGRCLVERGDPSQTITAVAEREAASLIVMGTHGRTGLAHLLIGSVAEKVVRHAPIPVLSIRPGRGARVGVSRGRRASARPRRSRRVPARAL